MSLPHPCTSAKFNLRNGKLPEVVNIQSRINAHVYPWLPVIQVCLHPHTMTAKDKCSTKKQHRPKAEQQRQRKETSVIETSSSDGAQEQDSEFFLKKSLRY